MAINLNQQNPNNLQGQQQGPQAAGAQQDQSKPRNTGFTNLKSVLNANQNNKLGQTIGQGVQNITNKTQGQTQQAQQNFAKDIGQSVQDIKAGQNVQSNLSNLDFSKNSDEASQKINELGNDQNAAVTANLRKGYQGPQGLQNQDQLQNQAQQLGQTAQGLLTQGGRQAALQRFVNAGPNYTQGKQQLDTMLLGQNQGAITQARRNAAQAAAGTNEAIQKAAQEGQTTGQTYNTLNQDIQGKIGGLGQNLGSALSTRATTMNADADKQLSELRAGLNNGSLNPDQYQFLVNNVLGGTENTYNLTENDLGGMVSANNQNTADRVAKQQEIQARDTLARLSGASSGDELVNLDESLAGSGKAGLSADAANYLNQKQAADQAIANFDFNTPYSGQKGFFTQNGPVTYDSAKKVADIIQANPANANKYYGNAFNALQQQGYGQGWDLSNSYAGQVASNALDSLNSQFQNTNKTYGIGQNLRGLLAKKSDKTFGVK